MTSPLPGLLARHDARDPVLWCTGGPIEAATLCRRVLQVAARLPEGDGAVLVSCLDTTSFVVAVLAAWRRGLSIALPPNTRARTLEEIREQASICTEISDADPRLVVDADSDSAYAEDDVLVDAPPGRRLASVYTSGSTGSHGIVHKSAAQLLGEAGVLAMRFDLDARARVLSTVPPHHIYGLLFGVLVPLCCGGSIIANVPFHAPAVEAVARASQASVLVSTPAHLRGLELVDSDAVETVTRVFSSGAPLHPSTAAKSRERFGCGVTEILGSTETGGIGWRQADGATNVPWRPLPGVRVGASEDGQLLLWSDFLPGGLPQPFHADDRIELLDTPFEHEQRFRHLGRVDDVVKVGGKRISLGMLEARLRSLPAVRDAAVFADDAPVGHDRRIRAAVVAPGEDADALRRALLEWFDPVVVPRRIVMVEELPRESTGKLRRAVLKALLDGESGRRAS